MGDAARGRHGRRIALVVAALAAFVLLFPVPAVRTFYKLELPHSALQGTLLIAALGAAALTVFWILSRRQGQGHVHQNQGMRNVRSGKIRG